MKKKFVILLGEDDEGHAALIVKNLRRAGIKNTVIQFRDGEDILDFLFRRGSHPYRETGTSYLVLLDVRMPKVDGFEVLEGMRQDEELKKLPVIMISTTDDPREVEHCRRLGCDNFFIKGVEQEQFMKAIRRLADFLLDAESSTGNSKI